MSEVLLHHVECGPVQLLNSAPTPATVLASLPGPDGAAQLCVQLATPVKHRLLAAASDADYPPGQLGRDAHGPFLWIYYAALHPRVPGIDLAKPALDLPVDVSYILDPSIGQADVLDATKMVWVATAFLNHSAQHSPAPLPSWPDLEDLEPDIRTAGGPPPHEGLEHRIEHALAQLSVVARIAARRTLPRPQFQEFPAVDAPGAAYTLDADNSLHYRSMDVLTGQPATRQTVDADELLYWIVDDAARAIAWSFAYRSPAARGTGADTLKATVALPLWAAFVSALDPRWGSKTQATIDTLLRNSKPTRRAS
ncbi:immunity 63 family protein [Mycolicibacterium goodii]|nr:immunity 63 family protein [Mycolicibacterium goodii]MBU8813862.1 immunity 63 family protein [Mycolicibacterium goodii]